MWSLKKADPYAQFCSCVSMDPENTKLLEKSAENVQQEDEQKRKEIIEKWVMTCAIYYCNLTLVSRQPSFTVIKIGTTSNDS